jgi:hypothetical protein
MMEKNSFVKVNKNDVKPFHDRELKKFKNNLKCFRMSLKMF